MGTPLAPPLANLIMEVLERRAFQTLRVQPFVYRRFIDDAFGVFIGNTIDRALFEAAMNNMAPWLRLTWTWGLAVDFLDLHVFLQRQQDLGFKLFYRTHQKIQNTYMYIPPTSFHAPAVFRGWIPAELRRYVFTCCLSSHFELLRKAFWNRLRRRGYSVHQLTPLFDSVRFVERNTLLDGFTAVLAKSPMALPPRVCSTSHHGNNKHVLLRT